MKFKAINDKLHNVNTNLKSDLVKAFDILEKTKKSTDETINLLQKKLMNYKVKFMNIHH